MLMAMVGSSSVFDGDGYDEGEGGEGDTSPAFKFRFAG